MDTHDNRPGDDGSRKAPMALVRPRRSRFKMGVGAAGLAAILGPAAYLTTSWLTADDTTETRDVTAIGTPAPQSSSSRAPAPSVSANTTMAGDAAMPEDSPSSSPTRSMSVDEQIKEARAKAEKDGYPLKRALTAGPDVAAPVGEVTVTNEGNLKEDGRTLRLVSARYDLTGQRELLWSAGKGKKVGNATCTQTFRFSNEAEPIERPSMLSCWRTSAKKSVVAIAVVRDGKPNAKSTVAELDKQWNKMD